LAYDGHNLAARAQRFHDWRFDVQGLVRTQIAQHSRLVKRWLSTGEGPSPRDRVLIDNTLRQLPPGARRKLAHHHPDTVDDLVRQLENCQVAQRLSYGTGYTPRPAETRSTSGGATSADSPATSPATALETGMCRCRRPTRTEGGARPVCWRPVGRKDRPGARPFRHGS
jgi:hypothetical protein